MPLARGFETEQIGDLVDLLIMRGFRDLVVQDERWIFSKVSLGRTAQKATCDFLRYLLTPLALSRISGVSVLDS